MADLDSQNPMTTTPTAPGETRRRSRGWIAVILILLVGGGVVAAWQAGLFAPSPGDGPLDAELNFLIAPTPNNKELLKLDDPAAFPVVADGVMSLEARFRQPAYAYFVWLDTDGRAMPLYPWNHDRIEVTDINQAPPVRRPSTLIVNPPMGGGWRFGKKGGLETILVLARRSPIDVPLGPLFSPVPPVPAVRHRGEVAILGLDRGADSLQSLIALNRGTTEESRAVDEPLQSLLLRLRDHFELIRAVRFAHVEEVPTDKE